MTDQYVAAFRVLVPQFAELSGATITLDELGYAVFTQKLIADFVGQTGNDDLMTVDIVWSVSSARMSTPCRSTISWRDEAELQSTISCRWRGHWASGRARMWPIRWPAMPMF